MSSDRKINENTVYEAQPVGKWIAEIKSDYENGKFDDKPDILKKLNKYNIIDYIEKNSNKRDDPDPMEF